MPGETFVAPVTKIKKFIAQHIGGTEIAATKTDAKVTADTAH
jgi:hypothetical protein